jgi:hypothetical protein
MTEEQKKVQSKFIPYWVALLKKNKVPDNIIPLLIAQIIFESNWFSSNAYIKDNNPGGITWNNKYLKRPGASIGIKRPGSEQDTRIKTNNYVHFDSFDSAAKDYVRVISQNGILGKPIEAKDFIDYAKRLKANKYYTATLDSYTAGLKAQLKRMYNWFDVASLIKNNGSNMASLQILLIPIILGFLFFKK